ncbi:vegetative cell wall protein gp1 [Dorcoceras hygrometricum]|uniref:Vegetative cell wall protein gp1 n=1 Tax=Dorcoceras hygrometricum TaxID=472368 RepID=A0A2Z7AJC2_9LAMI|nr:vegetative cell wall protein gp1 [Dorcoceras hygrometricum]
MASQQPRPPWFRFPALGNRPVAPAPTPTPYPAPPQPVPTRPPAPLPPITRQMIPAIPTIQPVQPTQTQESAPPPSTSPPPPSPPVPPRSPPNPAPGAAPPSPPILTEAPETAPGRSPATSPVQAATPHRSPPAQVEPPKRSSVVSPTFQPSSWSPPAQVEPPKRSPVVSPTIQQSSWSPPAPSPAIDRNATAARNVPQSSSPTSASPKIKTKSPSPSLPTSPPSKPVASPASNGAIAGDKPATPVSSERTPERSPRLKPLSNPPSPFTLPPTQKTEEEREPKFPAEVEQKTVLVQETIEKPKEMTNLHNKRVDSSGRKDHLTNAKGPSKKTTDSEESGTKVITLAGENKGAIMELSTTQRKNYPSGNPQRMPNNNTNYTGSHFDQSSSESGEEGNTNKDGKANRGKEMQSSPTAVFLNSNVQGVNNSILYNCNHRHNDPGVHISLTRKANGSRQKDHRGKTTH